MTISSLRMSIKILSRSAFDRKRMIIWLYCFSVSRLCNAWFYTCVLARTYVARKLPPWLENAKVAFVLCSHGHSTFCVATTTIKRKESVTMTSDDGQLRPQQIDDQIDRLVQDAQEDNQNAQLI